MTSGSVSAVGSTPAAIPSTVIDFLHDTTIQDLPVASVDAARRCLLDLIGVAAAGAATELSRIIRAHAVAHFGAGRWSSPLLFDGRKVSPPGAALAGGMTIDSIDAHDGHRLTKGHTGCHQLPALLAFASAQAYDDPHDFVATLVVGYEVATRAGIALHATADDYHTSGAWGAVGCAALGARLLELDHEATAHALGIAEYHGPRSQMMRVIDHPTMLKDGSGWGAMVGVSAAYLAAGGFTGAPAVTLADPAVGHLWADLGERWMIDEQYFKPHPVCRWAQPAVGAVLGLLDGAAVDASLISRIEIETFHEAVRLATVAPATTEEAQYSLPFPVAAAAVHGRLGPAEIVGDGLSDARVLALAARVEMHEDDAHNAAFPARRLARVTITLDDGRVLRSPDTEARGEPEPGLALSDTELRTKYHEFADPVLGVGRADRLERAIDGLADGDSLRPLFAELFTPT